ncbi:MAG: zinc ribbon domain-containing protein [Clostridia bacterium]|nr:zinc ribbon domain-containing protein [Clostridia bacterium]
MICPKCGYVLKDEDKFCINCGTPVGNADVEFPVPEAAEAAAPAAAAAVNEIEKFENEPVKPEPRKVEFPAPVDAEPAPEGKLDRPLSTWGYIWRLFLFAIPVLGLIPLFVLAFSHGVNKNSKHLASAILIMLLILVILLLAGAVVMLIFLDPMAIKEYLQNVMNALTTIPQ